MKLLPLLLVLAVSACSMQQVGQTHAAAGAYRAALKAQVIKDQSGDGLRPVARELRGIGDPDRGPAFAAPQESMTAPNTSGGGSGGR